MENVVWGGVPTSRKTKAQEFTNPVFTMSPIEKGSGRKITFNKAAQEALGIQGEDYVIFGFDKANNRIFVGKSQEDVKGSIQLTKTCSLSNKRVFEYIVKAMSLDTTVKNVFNLNTVGGESYLEASLRTDSTEETSEIGVTALGDFSAETTAAEQEDVIEVPMSAASTDSTFESSTDNSDGWDN
jgi:hypothetical protein